MNTVRAIQKLNARELEEGIAPSSSWHTDYRDTAFIYIGGLPFELSEGDIITIFSQYGEPVWIKLARDKETGKSRGFCWIKYEDQRSTDLAVDNLGGATVMGRVLRVDHTRYKPRDDEDMRDNTMGELDPVDDEDGRGKRRKSESETESEEERPLLKEEIELEKLIRDLDDDDPMKGAMVRRKKEEVEAALQKYEKAKRKDKKHREKRHHRRHRDDSRERDRDRKRIRDKDVREERYSPPSHRDRSRRDRRRSSSPSSTRGQRDVPAPTSSTARIDPDREHQKRFDKRSRDNSKDRGRDRAHHKDRDDHPSARPRYNSDEDDKVSRSKYTSRHDRSPDSDRGHRRHDRTPNSDKDRRRDGA